MANAEWRIENSATSGADLSAFSAGAEAKADTECPHRDRGLGEKCELAHLRYVVDEASKAATASHGVFSG